MKASEKQFGLYYQDQSLHDIPSEFISLAAARSLRKENKGYFVNSGQGFRMMSVRVQEPDNEELISTLKARDRSAQMPPSITEQYVDGHKGAVAIVEAWAFNSHPAIGDWPLPDMPA